MTGEANGESYSAPKTAGFQECGKVRRCVTQPAGKRLYSSRGLMPEACSLRAQRATVIERAGQKGQRQDSVNDCEARTF